MDHVAQWATGRHCVAGSAGPIAAAVRAGTLRFRLFELQICGRVRDLVGSSGGVFCPVPSHASAWCWAGEAPAGVRHAPRCKAPRPRLGMVPGGAVGCLSSRLQGCRGVLHRWLAVPRPIDGSRRDGSLSTWGAAMGRWGGLPCLALRRGGRCSAGLTSFMAMQMAAMDAAFSLSGVLWLGRWASSSLMACCRHGIVSGFDLWTCLVWSSSVASASVALRWHRWTVRPRLSCALRLLSWLFTQR